MEYHSTLKKRMKSCHLQQVKGKQILHGMTYMWNVECGKQNKQTQQNRNRLIDTENKLVIVRGEEGWGMSDIGEGD